MMSSYFKWSKWPNGMLLSSSLSGFPVSSLCFSLCDQEGLVKDEPTKHDKNTTATPFVPLDIQIPAEAWCFR